MDLRIQVHGCKCLWLIQDFKHKFSDSYKVGNWILASCQPPESYLRTHQRKMNGILLVGLVSPCMDPAMFGFGWFNLAVLCGAVSPFLARPFSRKYHTNKTERLAHIPRSFKAVQCYRLRQYNLNIWKTILISCTAKRNRKSLNQNDFHCWNVTVKPLLSVSLHRLLTVSETVIT